MIKSIGKITLVTILAALAVGVPLRLSAQDAKTNAAPSPATPHPTRPFQFRGKLAAVDKVTKTITLDEKTKRTFEITSETKLFKGSKPATLDDVMAGDMVMGTYSKIDDKLVAKRIYVGMRPLPGPATPPSAPPAAGTPPAAAPAK